MTVTYPKGVSIERAKEACEAQCNLNMFAGVVAMLEGGTIRGKAATKNAQRVIALCRAAQQVELRAYDKALGRKET